MSSLYTMVLPASRELLFNIRYNFLLINSNKKEINGPKKERRSIKENFSYNPHVNLISIMHNFLGGDFFIRIFQQEGGLNINQSKANHNSLVNLSHCIFINLAKPFY